MNEPKTIKLDLSDCKYFMELHQRIKETFHLPDYYGCNWSAFHDMLRGEIDAQYIEVYGEHTLPVQWQDQIAIFHDILEYTVQERLQLGETFGYTIID